VLERGSSNISTSTASHEHILIMVHSPADVMVLED